MTDQPSSKDMARDSIVDAVDGTMGQELRECREALGTDLNEIAESLHIRPEYLEALEKGDYDALPGTAYAVGFVRSYAKHLGIDSNEAALRFKSEVSGERPTARLDFPSPMAESRVPTGAVVFVTGLLALTVYGVWYYLNTRDMGFSDLIPNVPKQIGDESKKSGGPAPASPETAGATSPTAPGSTAPTTDVPLPSRDALARFAPAAPPVPAPAPAVLTPDSVPVVASASPPPSAATQPANQSGAQGSASAIAATPQPAPSAPVAVSLPLAPPEATLRMPGQPNVARAASPAPVASQPAPAPAPARPWIEIRAVADSWIQVRTVGGELRMTQILRQGNIYKVPREQGLMLTTGNAGGLEILVDGVKVPTLGPFGAVRRDVALDPARLKSGTAGLR
jgi:cytoskeleton protein RodZ